MSDEKPKLNMEAYVDSGRVPPQQQTTFNLRGKATNQTWANMSDEEKSRYVATLTPAHSINGAGGCGWERR